MSPAAAPTGRRAVAIRHEVTGTLEAVSALRAGGWSPSPQADLAVARDGLDRIVIPGTSLAGALRAWLGSVRGRDGSARFGPAALGRVFGALEHRGQGGEVCRIRVDDAVAEGDVTLEVRDGVGIDRGTATAAARVLYQHEVIPAGTRFAVRIVAEQARDDPEQVAEAVDLIIAGLAEGRVSIGAARSRGLGGVRLTGVRRAWVDLSDRGEVLDWLCGRLPSPPAAGSTAPAPAGGPSPADGRLDIEITWSAVTPVMVQASTVNEPDPDSARAVDTVPLRTTRTIGQNGPARLLLPGSSVKGVVRAHAERIVRILRSLGDVPVAWLEQLSDKRLGPVRALFGAAGDQPSDAGPGRRGALAVHDCLGDPVAERVVTHVAVDRWTGGAAENLLFSVQEPADATWDPIRMSLDVRSACRAGPGDEAGPGDGACAMALLLLVLRDLADGWLALGFGGTRGRGTTGVSRVAFSGEGLPHPWSGLSGRTLAGVTGDPPEGVRQAFAAWREWVRG